jgi:hypothetical protein
MKSAGTRVAPDDELRVAEFAQETPRFRRAARQVRSSSLAFFNFSLNDQKFFHLDPKATIAKRRFDSLCGRC